MACEATGNLLKGIRRSRRTWSKGRVWNAWLSRCKEALFTGLARQPRSGSLFSRGRSRGGIGPLFIEAVYHRSRANERSQVQCNKSFCLGRGSMKLSSSSSPRIRCYFLNKGCATIISLVHLPTVCRRNWGNWDDLFRSFLPQWRSAKWDKSEILQKEKRNEK